MGAPSWVGPAATVGRFSTTREKVDALNDEPHVPTFYRTEYQEGSVLGARPPWDIGRAQEAFVAVAESGALRGQVLDAGCGSGELSLYLAAQGHSVIGIDLSETAIEQARTRARERASTATFTVGSVLDLGEYEGRCQTVVDCGCLHSLPKDVHAAYTAELHRATSPGAHAYVLAMSPDAVAEVSERFGRLGVPEKVISAFPSVSPDDLHRAFGEGWANRSMDASTFEARFPGDQHLTPLNAWFGVFARL